MCQAKNRLSNNICSSENQDNIDGFHFNLNFDLKNVTQDI